MKGVEFQEDPLNRRRDTKAKVLCSSIKCPPLLTDRNET